MCSRGRTGGLQMTFGNGGRGGRTCTEARRQSDMQLEHSSSLASDVDGRHAFAALGAVCVRGRD